MIKIKFKKNEKNLKKIDGEFCIKDKISPDDFKNELNKKIVKILYEELEKGDISNVIGLFEKEEELLSHVTYILSKETEMKNTDKAIEDLVNSFIKERLQEEKSTILKKLISKDIDKEESKQLETRLKEISELSKKLVNIK